MIWLTTFQVGSNRESCINRIFNPLSPSSSTGPPTTPSHCGLCSLCWGGLLSLMGPLKQGQELRGGAQPWSKLWEQDLRSETPCQGGASQSSTQHPIQFQPPCCLQVRISFLIKICNWTFSFQAQGFQCRSCCHSGGGPFCLQQALHAN